MNARKRILLAIDRNRPIARLSVADGEELLQPLHMDMRRILCERSLPNSAPDADGYVLTRWGTRQRASSHYLVSDSESLWPRDKCAT